MRRATFVDGRFNAVFIERFLSKLEQDPDSACVLWMGATTPDGYGVLKVPAAFLPGRLAYAHRIAFYLFRQEWVEPGEDVHHRCRCRQCCNGDHLERIEAVVHRVETLVPGGSSREEFFF